MSALKVGALFAGYSGIELALRDVLDTEPAWFVEFDKGPSAILAHHYPDVPNLHDVTKVDWSTVEPVDVITGGSPCQDLSHAGKRQGMRTGTRSGLWASMCDAVDIIRPRLVVWENVRGALSAAADSAVEPCPLCVGDKPGVSLRALGRVLGDLAELGYDAAWHGLRAADVGAPHGRWRVFVLAWRQDDTERIEPHAGAGRVGGGSSVLRLLPTPEAKLGSSRPDYARATRPGTGGDSLHEAIGRLLPTPAVNDMGASYTPEAWDEWTARMKAEHGNGNGHGNSLHVEALRLLPTPVTTDAAGAGAPAGSEYRGTSLTDATERQPEAWGQYAPAIARWEALTRPAPSPTERDWSRWETARARRLSSRMPVGMRGSIRFLIDGPPARLSPVFVEWLMGLPAGWVTDPAIWTGWKPGAARNAQLKALGNGVVPQQCAAALRHLLEVRNEHMTKAVA